MTNNKYGIWIKIVSVLIPVVVAILFTVRIPNVEPLSFLPPIYASINALTALLLILALKAIKSGKRQLHERLMKVCIGLSLVFLVMYIAYHMTSDPTSFGGEGVIAYLYYIILISHIILSIILIPLVLTSYVRAIQSQFDPHKKIARITFPIWLYVAVTGVVVYLMISPYY
jgi:putative membrane protein|tara:strand:+ start:620 stop:1132 length:513 start_codon:yes stop_codon:yes gene_type:complete